MYATINLECAARLKHYPTLEFRLIRYEPGRKDVYCAIDFEDGRSGEIRVCLSKEQTEEMIRRLSALDWNNIPDPPVADDPAIQSTATHQAPNPGAQGGQS